MKIRDDLIDDGVSAPLNLTSLIDVVFNLLIFFMVSTKFIDLEKDLEIDLPEASAGEGEAVPAAEIVINVHSDGSVRVDGRETTVDALTQLLQRAVTVDPEQPVTIRGDRQVPYENVVSVIDACRIAAVRNIAVTARDRQ